MSHQTYLTGTRMIYDPAVLKSLDMFGAALRRGRYLATWRILHIDGFEGTPRIPQRSGRQIQFFDFETRPLLALGSCGCCREEVPEVDARLRAGLPLHFTVQAAPVKSTYHRYVNDVDIVPCDQEQKS